MNNPVRYRTKFTVTKLSQRTVVFKAVIAGGFLKEIRVGQWQLPYALMHKMKVGSTWWANASANGDGPYEWEAQV